jgi:transcription elongation GreA/GreB family factor
LLGLKIGDEANLPMPFHGAGRIKVIEILYQPEEAGDLSS